MFIARLLGKTLLPVCTLMFLNVAASAAGLSASATYTVVADPTTSGLYDYNLTLKNTGTTTIGTFWFAWVPGGDFLSPKPTNVGLPAGWTDSLFDNTTKTGTSIRWVTTTSLLQAGDSLSGFSFVSAETPAQLLANVASGTGAGDPVLTSFVYSTTPFSDAGYQFAATAATPEPSSLLLLATGLLGGAGACGRRLRPSRNI